MTGGTVTGKEYFQTICAANNVHADALQLDLLQRYVDILSDFNTRLNLISRADKRDVWRSHLLHSVALMTQFPLHRGGRYFDLGSGGGLPGIPLAIMHPAAEFVLNDSIRKKVDAVEEMKQTLHLANVTTVVGRAEELPTRPGFACGFDAVFARAVGGLEDLVRFAFPLLKSSPAAILVAWKGGDLGREIAHALRIRKVSSIESKPIRLAGEPRFEAERKQLVYVTFRRG